MAADSVEQLLHWQLHKSSPYICLWLPFCDVNNVIDVKDFFNFNRHSQEEAGAAEEQPASNKADA